LSVFLVFGEDVGAAASDFAVGVDVEEEGEEG